jgi:replicative DNA helicase Mcm
MQVIKPQIDKDLLRKYIAYARRNVSPTMSPEAEEHFIEHYRNLRGSKESKSPVPITARNLEGLIRMGEASARIRLSDTVTLEDAKRVCKLSTECATELGSVHSNGPLDVEVINAHNNQKSQRDKIRAIKEFLSDKRSEYPKGIPIDVICEHMKEKEGIDPSTSNELIQKLRRSGDALMPFSGLIKLV